MAANEKGMRSVYGHSASSKLHRNIIGYTVHGMVANLSTTRKQVKSVHLCLLAEFLFQTASHQSCHRTTPLVHCQKHSKWKKIHQKEINNKINCRRDRGQEYGENKL